MNLNKETELEPSGEFAAAIRDFRSVVEHVTAREMERPVAANWLAPARQRRRSAHQRMALGWACAALLCLATLPFSIHSNHVTTHQVASAPATAHTESDTTLLEQVDTEVSESVPSSLAPLTELDSLNTESTNTSSSSSANGTALK